MGDFDRHLCSAQLVDGIGAICHELGIPGQVQGQGSMLCLYLSAEPVRNLDAVTASDRARWTRFFNGMLERGVILPPSPYEAWFLSTAHDQAIIDRVLGAAREALAASAD